MPGLADHDLEVGVALGRAGEDQPHQHGAHVHLEAGDVHGLDAAHDVRRHLGIVGRAAADGVEVQRDAGLVRELPQRLPVLVPQRRHVGPVGDVEAAHAALGVAHRLGDRTPPCCSSGCWPGRPAGRVRPCRSRGASRCRCAASPAPPPGRSAGRSSPARRTAPRPARRRAPGPSGGDRRRSGGGCPSCRRHRGRWRPCGRSDG